VQLYHYFVSQSSEFCRHNPLCCFSTSVCCCCYFVIDSVQKLFHTPSYQELSIIYIITLWIVSINRQLQGANLYWHKCLYHFANGSIAKEGAFIIYVAN